MTEPSADDTHQPPLRDRVLGPKPAISRTPEADAFMAPFEELADAACWQRVWGRPGLDLKTRSLLNIAMLCTMRQWDELGQHVAGAVRNGATPEEVREVLLQVAVYAGFPAASQGFRVAREVLGLDDPDGDRGREKAGSNDGE